MADKLKLNFTQSSCIKCCEAVVTDRQTEKYGQTSRRTFAVFRCDCTTNKDKGPRIVVQKKKKKKKEEEKEKEQQQQQQPATNRRKRLEKR